MGSDIEIYFGQAVKKHRARLKLSQEALAHLAGIHRTYLSDVERGARNVSLRNVAKIAAALGVSPSSLMPTESVNSIL